MDAVRNKVSGIGPWRDRMRRMARGGLEIRRFKSPARPLRAKKHLEWLGGGEAEIGSV